jgi:hypothetical protein
MNRQPLIPGTILENRSIDKENDTDIVRSTGFDGRGIKGATGGRVLASGEIGMNRALGYIGSTIVN